MTMLIENPNFANWQASSFNFFFFIIWHLISAQPLSFINLSLTKRTSNLNPQFSNAKTWNPRVHGANVTSDKVALRISITC